MTELEQQPWEWRALVFDVEWEAEVATLDADFDDEITRLSSEEF